jgi:RIO kinase 1
MIDDEVYETQFETRAERRRARPGGISKRKPTDVRAARTDTADDAEPGFRPSYKSSHHDHGEMQWIIDAVSGFYADKLIDDVLRAVKGGKEASVYVCRAHASTGVPFMAAKIYRPRMFRSLKNDALYREGRQIIGEEGKSIKARDQRAQRAVKNMTRFGQELRIGSWIGHEYETLRQLHAAGADIPKPYAQSGTAIVMAYLGDENAAAPTLNNVALEANEARRLFERVMHNVELMLAHHCVHADLSAYNLLYWDGEITLIDFPQAVDPRVNRHAASLLARDVERTCQYFARFGVQADAGRLSSGLRARYMRGEM